MSASAGCAIRANLYERLAKHNIGETKQENVTQYKKEKSHLKSAQKPLKYRSVRLSGPKDIDRYV